MRAIKLFTLAFLALAVSAGPATVADANTEGSTSAADKTETSHKVIYSPVHRIVIDAKAGEVSVTSTRRRGVDVTLTRKWLFSKPTTNSYVRDGILHLEGRCHHGVLCGTDFKVLAPPGVAIDVHGEATKVDVKGAPGNVSLDTDVGDLKLDLSRAPRSISAKSHVSDIRINVPTGTYAVDLHARVGDEKTRGIIRFDRASHSIRAMTSIGDITVEGR
jgi:hypothetical protein